ncbi:MAG: hypothetical protein Q8M66_08175 [Actinomycetota bacterium]|nr:hypothetical protein [Actinomycetota bacterium]
MGRLLGAFLVVVTAVLLIAIDVRGGFGPAEWSVFAAGVIAGGIVPFILGLTMQLVRKSPLPLYVPVLIGVLVTTVRLTNPFSGPQITPNVWESPLANVAYLVFLSVAFAEIGSALVRIVRARSMERSGLQEA